MQIRYGRLGGLAALTALITLASGPLQAGQEVSMIETNAEDSLLGIHLINSTFRDVLKKYGQPNEIQAGGPFMPTPPPGVASASSGGGGGPMPGGMGKPGGPTVPGGKGGMGPSSGGMGGPSAMGGPGGGGSKKVPSKNGFPGKDSTGASGGGPGGPGMAGGGGPSPMGGPGGPGGPSSMGGGGGGGGLPGFQGSGAGGPAGGSEGEGGVGTGEEESTPPVKETTWWYHDVHEGTHIAFVFNRVGQVIQIGEYGGSNASAKGINASSKPLEKMNGVLIPNKGASRRGVALGMMMGDIIKRYGWSLDGAHDGDNVIMRFGGRHRIAFQIVRNRILGITVGYVKSGNSITPPGE